jgi:hypothetical protein
MMRNVLVTLFILCVASATAPFIYEQKNLGFYNFPEFTYSLSVDCEEGTIDAILMDANFTRLEGVNSYLKYVDFESKLISSETSDEHGIVEHELPGNVSLMRGLFIMVIEEKGFRSKEIHFDISPCYSNVTFPPPPQRPERNGTMPPEEDVTEPEAPPPVPPENISGNGETVNETDVTAEGPAPEEEWDIELVAYALAAVVLLLLLYKTFTK